ncbi:ABC transporter permease [Peptoniphilus indolicus]|uniref:Glycine betaine/L-proline ABC superfamily ATP binding cassette transporter, permease protein n=2 Tax=Peptoniphilus indolicus TaxID=33030 RepID=G4D2U8_9FIRM|nr:ABC transporter permease [Peptoniphilus indolicus]EGY80145.1 glycine betaine/L-proline ABC superfamily ATP binding cassette transporter, permease protein [Peptoniphilus indolicus ATCC 29427]SUB75186.1 Putative osmoprotectant uptake system permease protein yehW [Peptoniphilus indolicus]
MIKEMFTYYSINGLYVVEQFIRHFLISIYGVLFAAIVAIPLGFFISRRYNLSDVIIGFANVLQTIPSLALLAILMLGLGIGSNTVILAVFLYSLLPILKNTVTAINSIKPEIMDAAKGMGMTRIQSIFKVEIPLSISVIMGGIRNALVVAIGVTAVGTFIGAGGLGDIITRGINVAHGQAIILAGALPTALMAILADVLLGWVEKKLLPVSYTKNK